MKTLCYMLLAGAMFSFMSCDQALVSREYEEVITMTPDESIPHDFVGRLPADHPDISSSVPLLDGQDDDELQKALDASVVRSPLTWNMPPQWVEEKGSGMRLVTFRPRENKDSMECSIVSLGGQAGGLKSNVTRWITQLNAPVPPSNQLDAFLSGQPELQTDGGFLIKIIDLTELIDSSDSASLAMMGAVAELGKQTIFIKMTGSREAVRNHRDSFVSLCQSLVIP